METRWRGRRRTPAEVFDAIKKSKEWKGAVSTIEGDRLILTRGSAVLTIWLLGLEPVREPDPPRGTCDKHKGLRGGHRRIASCVNWREAEV